ncbi:unnamed protein product [Rotaria sp. Silwood2]|nr:unnamed protein product [Rotaria sp. Silwood2]CAF3293759.1 unnamed protein product [Rotaria sp. Silwood2]
MIEVLFAVREDQFEENPAIPTSLDFVAEMNQLTYMLTLDSTCKPEPISEEKQHTIVDETETTLLKPRQEVYPILEKGIAPEKCGYILL